MKNNPLVWCILAAALSVVVMSPTIRSFACQPCDLTAPIHQTTRQIADQKALRREALDAGLVWQYLVLDLLIGCAPPGHMPTASTPYGFSMISYPRGNEDKNKQYMSKCLSHRGLRVPRDVADKIVFQARRLTPLALSTMPRDVEAENLLNRVTYETNVFGVIYARCGLKLESKRRVIELLKPGGSPPLYCIFPDDEDPMAVLHRVITNNEIALAFQPETGPDAIRNDQQIFMGEWGANFQEIRSALSDMSAELGLDQEKEALAALARAKEK
jgi:hypothetical protein